MAKLKKKRKQRRQIPELIVGWREWVSLPGLGLPPLRAKIDSGAKTSALHATGIHSTGSGKRQRVHFNVHQGSGDDEISWECSATPVDFRQVSDSGGHREWRWVIRTELFVGGLLWPIELTLTDRRGMRFRMLLGRSAMADRLLVDPGSSYHLGRRPSTAAHAVEHKHLHFEEGT